MYSIVEPVLLHLQDTAFAFHVPKNKGHWASLNYRIKGSGNLSIPL